MDGAVTDDVQRQLLGFREEVENHGGERPHDHFARTVVASAIQAGLEGNGAVGALLANPAGEVVASERNEMFVPYFRSDYHAEMVLLSRYEEQHRSISDLRGYTLVTSLEPCEMCNIRIINSGVTNVLYVASDVGKGAITGPNELAPHWARLAESQNFAEADCDQRLATIALQAFERTIGSLTAKLIARRVVEQGD